MNLPHARRIIATSGEDGVAVAENAKGVGFEQNVIACVA